MLILQKLHVSRYYETYLTTFSPKEKSLNWAFLT